VAVDAAGQVLPLASFNGLGGRVAPVERNQKCERKDSNHVAVSLNKIPDLRIAHSRWMPGWI
jgi:hypothetical protein